MTRKDNNILFFINSLGIGGAERVFIRDANILEKEGFNVFFVTFFKNPKENLLSGLQIPKEKILNLESSSIFDFKSILKLWTFISKNKINKVLSTLNEANLIIKIVKLLKPNISLYIREANIADPKSLKFKFFDFILNFCVKKIIAVSVEVKDSLSYIPFSVGKIEILPNGVFLPNQSKNYKDSNILNILNVGSLNEKKGQKYLIEAVSLVVEKHPNVFLNIFGTGNQKDILSNLINNLKLEKYIKINDPVSHLELEKIYLDSDIFILSSLWEGSPNVLLEAMSFGLCSISTDVSGAVDMLSSDSGILVKKGDSYALSSAICSLLEDRSKMTFFGKNAREKIKDQYCIDIHMDKLKKILDIY